MKKILSIILAAVMVASCAFCLSGCGKKVDAYELVMITNGATITDGGYNQSAWQGVENYASDNGIACRYYQPQLVDDVLTVDEVDKYISLAVDNGAKTIVLPGVDFAVIAYELAPKYKDVDFLLLDAYPCSAEDSEPTSIANVMTVDFDELEAGFLAGYSAVTLGKTKLGYLGSVNEAESTVYGAGYVQGAAMAADNAGVPTIMEYANYDASDLNYDYSFSIKPIYVPVADAKKETFKINVVGGIGSGVYTDGENVTISAQPAEEGKAFDHWEVKSDTKGVKDKKVNISSKKTPVINLVVGDCDATITAVWKDVKTVPVNIHKSMSSLSYTGDVVATYNVPENSSYDIVAPTADSGMVFSSWLVEEGSIDELVSDQSNAWTTVNVTDKAVDLIASYDVSDVPTFDVTVENGTGSGAYRAGDYVEIVADAPEDGYMFYKWENIDNQGLSTGIAMENEYCYRTHFDMVDRYASIAEAMFDEGTEVIFGGGNPQSDSIFTATWSFDYQVYGFGAGVNQNSWGNCLASVVKDYRVATETALADFKGGTNMVANCSNHCLYVTNIPEDNKMYEAIYHDLEDGSVDISKDASKVESKCLTVNYWVK